MAQKIQFEASLREKAGKGSARATRREGNVPAVIYGDNKEPLTVSIPENEVKKVLNKGGLMTGLTEISVGGEKHTVLARDIQFHPVNDLPQHIDFLRVSAKTKIIVSIPVEFKNEEASPGLERGGILSVIRHAVDLRCSATKIPSSIEVDLTGLDIGDSIHLNDLKLPEATFLTTEANSTVAAVVAPSVSLSEETEAEEGAEEAEGEASEASEASSETSEETKDAE